MRRLRGISLSGSGSTSSSVMGTALKGWLGEKTYCFLPPLYARFSKATKMIAARQVSRSFRMAQSVQGYFRVIEKSWYAYWWYNRVTAGECYYVITPVALHVLPYALPCDANVRPMWCLGAWRTAGCFGPLRFNTPALQAYLCLCSLGLHTVTDPAERKYGCSIHVGPSAV